MESTLPKSDSEATGNLNCASNPGPLVKSKPEALQVIPEKSKFAAVKSGEAEPAKVKPTQVASVEGTPAKVKLQENTTVSEVQQSQAHQGTDTLNDHVKGHGKPLDEKNISSQDKGKSKKPVFVPDQWQVAVARYLAKEKLPNLRTRVNLMLANLDVATYISSKLEERRLQPYTFKQESRQAVNFALALGKSMRYQISQHIRTEWNLNERYNDDKEFEAYMKRVLVAIVLGEDYLKAVEELNAHNAARRPEELAEDEIPMPVYHSSHMFPQQICLFVDFFNQYCASKSNIRVALALRGITENPEPEEASVEIGREQIPSDSIEDVEYAQSRMEGKDPRFVFTHDKSSATGAATTVFVECRRFAEYHPYVDIEKEKSDPAPAFNTYLMRIEGQEEE